MNIVLDTNIIISALLSSEGAPAKVFELVLQGNVRSTTTNEILQEVEEVLKRPRIRKHIPLEQSTLFLQLFREASNIVNPSIHYDTVREDSDDNKFIDCAKESEADMIITGDAHLLVLKEFQGVRIGTSRDFLDFIEHEP